MFDFLNKLKKKKPQRLYRSGWGSESNFIQIGDYITSAPADAMMSGGVMRKEDLRISKKPVEVYEEIMSPEPQIDLSNLDEKIKIVKRRMTLLQDELGLNVSDEPEALEFLNARKKLVKSGSSHGFGWATTTREKVDALCKKYRLANVDVQSYYKTMPLEAIEELEKFLKEYKKYTTIHPVIRLIIDDEPAKKEADGRDNERKKDPILLASSPFGKWFFVLGAWDKEVAIVDDLIYNGK